MGWVEDGEPPPVAPRPELTGAAALELSRDPHGIVLGGLPTPPVDVPARDLSGVKGPSDSVICLLSGSTVPMPAERLAELHPSRAAFEQQYDAAVDEAIDAGFVLEDDRTVIQEFAHPELVAG